MDKSTAIIMLCLGTLLIGLAISIYQLWSSHHSQKKGDHSTLAARFGGKKRMLPRDPDSVFTSDDPTPKRAQQPVA